MSKSLEFADKYSLLFKPSKKYLRVLFATGMFLKQPQ